MGRNRNVVARPYPHDMVSGIADHPIVVSRLPIALHTVAGDVAGAEIELRPARAGQNIARNFMPATENRDPSGILDPVGDHFATVAIAKIDSPSRRIDDRVETDSGAAGAFHIDDAVPLLMALDQIVLD